MAGSGMAVAISQIDWRPLRFRCRQITILQDAKATNSCVPSFGYHAGPNAVQHGRPEAAGTLAMVSERFSPADVQRPS
jgi:hypothetical protein